MQLKQNEETPIKDKKELKSYTNRGCRRMMAVLDVCLTIKQTQDI